MSDKQTEHVVALVKERHTTVRQAFNELLNAYARGEKSGIISSNENFRDALHQLGAVVARSLWPNWLADLTLNADRYITNHSNGLATWRAHLDSAIKYRDSLNGED